MKKRYYENKDFNQLEWRRRQNIKQQEQDDQLTEEEHEWIADLQDSRHCLHISDFENEGPQMAEQVRDIVEHIEGLDEFENLKKYKLFNLKTIKEIVRKMEDPDCDRLEMEFSSNSFYDLEKTCGDLSEEEIEEEMYNRSERITESLEEFNYEIRELIKEINSDTDLEY